MIAPARTAAFDALRAMTHGRVELPAALQHARQRLQDDRDRTLAAEIVLGTLRWQRALDHIVVEVAGRPLDRIEPAVVLILRLSLYQILHLDRVPASAVVDDAVSLARRAKVGRASGFVNAVLRSVLRRRPALPLPPRPADDGDRRAMEAYLGITHSHPDWLVSRWLDRHGFDATESWVRFDNETPRLTLRANTLAATRDGVARALAEMGVETEPTRWSADGLVVTEGHPLRAGPDPRWLVQDEASQLIPLVVGASPGERVLDVCAAPGGKTVAMAASMSDTGVLVACDVRPKRLALLRATLRTSGIAHGRVVHVDTRGALPFPDVFDRVLVDAPCSGLGTIRRDPDIRWRRREGDLVPFARDQNVLLRRAAGAVRPGGRLVYATCSSEPEENEAVVEEFLAAHPAFEPVDLRTELEPGLQPLLDPHGWLRTLPFAHGLEAFFAAALRRRA